MKTKEQIDALLIKQLLNETTAGENQEVDAWRTAGEANEKYYQDFKTIWETSKHLQSDSEIDEDASWQRFRERAAAAAETPRTAPLVPAKKRFGWVKAAAALVVIAGGAFTMNAVFGNKDITLASANKVLTDTLPDGSVVTLNKHSSLVYSKDFNNRTRNVELNGEAFFNVAPNKQKPFDIKVGNIHVHVVGTSFNVKEDNTETSVIVETGIVKVSMQKDSVKLLPKEKVTIPKNTRKMQVEKNNDLLYNYYRTKTFECHNTPLHELADALNKAYDVQIVVADKIKNLPNTTTFRDEPLNDILHVIAATHNLSIEQKEGKILLK